MNKKDLELFKQAIDEGISNRFDKLAAACTEEIVCSEKHNLAMRAIIYGKADTKRAWSPRIKRIVAILVAAALLLTSCGIIFRDEIREVFEEFFVTLYFGSDESQQIIEDVYMLGYVPDGYVINNETKGFTVIQYGYINSDNNILVFEQSVITNAEFVVDSEESKSEIINILNIEVYHRYTDENHYYIWRDNKYAMSLSLEYEISIDELSRIIEGITVK